MRKIMWFVLGFVLVFAWGMAQAAERPKEWPLDWVASGTSSGVIAATPGATGVFLFGVGNPCAPSGVTKNADPGGTGLTGDSGTSFYYAWTPLTSAQDFGDFDTLSDLTPFYTGPGAMQQTIGGVSTVPYASVNIPATERIAVFFVTGSSQMQVPGSAILVVK